MNNELVSVIMSIYKENKIELNDSINSILNQTYKNIEFIIVIDNPKEQWRIDYIKKIKDKRVKIIVNKKNIGLPRSLNKALKKSKGKYICRMDADDISDINRIETQIKYMKEHNLDICGSYINRFFNDKCKKINKFPITPTGIHKIIYQIDCIAHPTFCVKREVYETLKGYKNIHTCEDYEFLLRADKNGFKMGNTPKVLLNYRIKLDSISRSNQGKQVLLSNYIKKWYKNHDKDITIKDIDNFLKSNKYLLNINKYNEYWKIRNIRSTKRNELLPFIFYTIKSLKYFNITIDELYNRILEKYIIIREKNK